MVKISIACNRLHGIYSNCSEVQIHWHGWLNLQLEHKLYCGILLLPGGYYNTRCSCMHFTHTKVIAVSIFLYIYFISKLFTHLCTCDHEC